MNEINEGSAIDQQGEHFYLRFGEGARGLSGFFGGTMIGRAFPGRGTGFLCGTTGAAGLSGLKSGEGLSTVNEGIGQKSVFVSSHFDRQSTVI